MIDNLKCGEDTILHEVLIRGKWTEILSWSQDKKFGRLNQLMVEMIGDPKIRDCNVNMWNGYRDL